MFRSILLILTKGCQIYEKCHKKSQSHKVTQSEVGQADRRTKEVTESHSYKVAKFRDKGVRFITEG